MTFSRQDALRNALATATEAMHAKGEVQPMIIGHAGNRVHAWVLGNMMNSAQAKDIRSRHDRGGNAQA
jgi:hypothetical protein